MGEQQIDRLLTDQMNDALNSSTDLFKYID